METPDALSAETVDAAPDAVPRLVGDRFEIGALLAEGGMGAVYRGHDRALDRPVAIKFLAARLRADRQLVARFRREAAALASLEHPHIVPIYAVGETDGAPWFAMKLVPGQSLDRLLRGRGRLSLPAATHLGVQLCDALTRIHAAGFVHRDVKPGNIVVGDDGHATLLDLGIARAEDSELTRTGAAIGSPHFMSPEQGREARDVDLRSDLYSLGATLYAALTGQAPFQGASGYDVIHLHVTTMPEPPSRRVPVPAFVDAFVARAMAKAPGDRFPDAASMRAALLALATPDWHAPLEAGPVETPRLRLLAVAGVVALAAGLVLWRWPGAQPQLGNSLVLGEAPPAGALTPGSAAGAPSPSVASAATTAPGASAQANQPGRPPVSVAPEPARPLAVKPTPPGASAAIAAPASARAAATAADSAGSSTPASTTGGRPSKPSAAPSTAAARSSEPSIGPSPSATALESATVRVVTRDREGATWAQIAIDGVAHGTSPIGAARLPAGRHAITARREGFAPASAVVDLRGGEERRVVLELQPARAP